MPREEGWYFLQAGKFLERAERTARTLDVKYRLLVGGDDEGLDRVALAAAARRRPAVEPAAALAVGVRVVPPHREQGRPAARRDRAADPLARPSRARSASRSGEVDAALAHITEVAPAYNGSEPMPGASAESEARREVGRLHAELAYQRLDDLLDRGLHASLLDLQRHVLPHRRPNRRRVLRPPASDRAGGDGDEVPDSPPDELPLRERCVRELQRGAAAAACRRGADPASTSTS